MASASGAPLTAKQCRAARGLLGWSQGTLSKKTKIATSTIANFEGGKTSPYRSTLRDLERIFKKAGIIFIAEGEVSRAAGEGVRMKKGR
ncbi:MAG: helix-turn-helix domain-containing protein [Sphingomonadales bacterium]|nr:helix-turn-helix domain-containing protein [Sphingomonadales bacterium]